MKIEPKKRPHHEHQDGNLVLNSFVSLVTLWWNKIEMFGDGRLREWDSPLAEISAT